MKVKDFLKQFEGINPEADILMTMDWTEMEHELEKVGKKLPDRLKGQWEDNVGGLAYSGKADTVKYVHILNENFR